MKVLEVLVSEPQDQTILVKTDLTIKQTTDVLKKEGYKPVSHTTLSPEDYSEESIDIEMTAIKGQYHLENKLTKTKSVH